MIRLLLLASGVALGACGPPPTDLAPDALRAAYRDALLDGDRDRALDLLGAGAEAGHLFALAALADAHEKGYLTVPWDAERKAAGVLVIRTLPGQAALARRRYEHALERGARDGDPGALLSVALKLVGPLYLTDGEMTSRMAPGDRDSAHALYRRLLDTDVPRMPLAHVARALGEDADHDRLLQAAADDGEPHACTTLLWSGDDRPDLTSTAGVADYVDRLVGCAPDGAGVQAAAEQVGRLQTEVARGNAAAEIALDSLRQLGVFERHPGLAKATGVPSLGDA